MSEARISDPNSQSTPNGELCRCIVDRTPLVDSPAGLAVSELLFGEAFCVERSEGDWVFGRSSHDDYPAWTLRNVLSGNIQFNPTHYVAVRCGLLFSKPDIKAVVIGRPSLGAQLMVTGEQRDFFVCQGGFIHRRHVAPIEDVATDPVDVALRLSGAPYLWGGRSGDGIDCSGLIQVALGLCGVAAPRDSTPQRALGQDLASGERSRGDLVFFPGHVGIMTSATELLHANAFWMTTLVEPLAHVVARLASTYAQPIVATRRLDVPAIRRSIGRHIQAASA